MRGEKKRASCDLSVVSKANANHQLCLPQVNAGIFSMKLSDWFPTVLGGAQWIQWLWESEFPVKPPFSFFFLYFLADALGWRWLDFFTETSTLSCFSSAFPWCVWFFSFFLRSHFTQTVTKLNPMFGSESRKAPWSWLHSQCGNAHPLLLPPSLSPQSVDHPETGSSLFVFLKKGPCCFSFPSELPCCSSSSQTETFSIACMFSCK